MSGFVKQVSTECSFKNSDSWVILSEMEQCIKRKIETIGTPLKDWDIQINYGIKTGCNEAFIINTEKRNEIMANCKTQDERDRTEALIRPILRGRDINRYGYDWANLWLINTHNGLRGRLPRIRIEDYPTVKDWLDNGGIAYNGNMYRGYEQIATRRDQGDTPYNLRNCKYLEDFSKHKIAWASVGETYYSLVEKDMMLLDTNYFFSIKNEVYAYYLLGILNSRLVTFWINSEDTQIGGGGAYRHYKYNLEKICIPIVQEVSIFNDIVEQILRCVKEKKDSSIYVNELNKQVYLIYNLTQDECDFIDSALKEDKQTHHQKDYIIHR